MRKWLVVIAGVVIALPVVAFVVDAQTTASQITSFAENVNTLGSGGQFQLQVSYDAAETEMGLGSTSVQFVNPVIRFAATPAAAAGAEAAKPVTWESRMQGTFTVTKDYSTHSYRVVMDGMDTLTVDSGVAKHTSQPTKLHYTGTLSARSFADFVRWHLGASDPEARMAVLRGFGDMSFTSDPIDYVEAASGEVMAHSEGIQLRVTNRSQAETLAGDIQMQAKAVYSGDMLMLWARQFETALTSGGMPRLPMTPGNPGKQDMVVDASMEFPEDFKGVAASAKDVHVNVRRVYVKNDFFTADYLAGFDVTHADTTRRMATKFSLGVEITPAGSAETKRRFTELSQALATGKAGIPLPPIALTAAEQEKIFATLPTVSDLGTVRFQADITEDSKREPARIDAKKAPSLLSDAGTLTINQVALAHKRWALLLQGAMTSAVNAPDTGKLTLLCRACSRLVSDIVEKGAQVMDTANAVGKPLPEVKFGPEMVASINGLIQQFGKAAPNTDDVTFVIEHAADGGSNVNGHPIPVVMQAAMQQLLPYMSQPGAPVQAAPVPQVSVEPTAQTPN